jgi:hypothetical protein
MADAADAGIWIGNNVVDTNMRVVVSVQLLTLDNIEIDGERPRDNEESQWHNHGNTSAGLISNVSENSWDTSATRDRGNEERSTALGVTSKTTEGKCEDGRENAGFEEEDEHQHGKTTPVRSAVSTSVDSDGSGDEDHDEGLVGKEDITRLSNVHQSSGGETTNGEKTLGNGVEIGTLFLSGEFVEIWTGLFVVVDEVTGNCHLGVLVIARRSPVVFPVISFTWAPT